MDHRIPNFLIIGAPRTGTTTLYEALRQHPDVFMSPRKEPWFAGFTGDPGPWKGPGDSQPVAREDQYVQLFSGCKGYSAVGEASTTYLSSPEAPKRIHDRIPNARLIVVLRDPVERAYSNYNQHVLQEREDEPKFLRAIQKEDDRIKLGWAPFWAYRGLSLYFEALTRYTLNFPRDHIRVFLFEDLQADPERVVRETFRFIGVDPSVLVSLAEGRNQSGTAKSARLHRWLTGNSSMKRALAGVLSTKVRQALRRWVVVRNISQRPLSPDERRVALEFFSDDVERTASLLGSDLGHWRSQRPDREKRP